MMLFVNGVDATSGEYLIPPLTEHDLALAVQGMQLDRASTAELQGRHRRATESHLAPRHGIDPADLAQSGWGIVTARDADPAVLAALHPLLEHRRGQASRLAETRYRELTGVDGYRRGESKHEFQARLGAGPGPVDPDVMPYYLLIVGAPDEVPFDVQYQLDVQHAVGRLHFANLEQYAAYARTVVARETSPWKSAPTDLCVFATRNDGDRATELCEANLARPLAQALADDQEHWRVTRLLGADATKAGLAMQVNGGSPPEVLVTASHGVAFPSGHPMQGPAQGALLCQDWAGPGHGPVTPSQWFGAGDVGGEADLSNTIALFFACFGAGTPREDNFGQGGQSPRPLAPAPFVAALPQALLGREGGALAVVGHVDRAWGYSFLWPGAGAQTEVFRSCLSALGAGQPVGAAFEYMGDRHAEIATELAHTLEMVHLGKRADESALAGLWTAYADARNVVVLGDPAARLRQSPSRPSTAQHPEVIKVQHDRPGSAKHVAAGRPPGPPDIEVATYVTEDPSKVTIDTSSGRISGARLQLHSFVRRDGNAQHVITMPIGDPIEDHARDLAVADIHARLLEVSLAAERARRPRRESSSD